MAKEEKHTPGTDPQPDRGKDPVRGAEPKETENLDEDQQEALAAYHERQKQLKDAGVIS